MAMSLLFAVLGVNDPADLDKPSIPYQTDADDIRAAIKYDRGSGTKGKEGSSGSAY